MAFVCSIPSFTLSDGSTNDGYLLRDGVHLTKAAMHRVAKNIGLKAKDATADVCDDGRVPSKIRRRNDDRERRRPPHPSARRHRDRDRDHDKERRRPPHPMARRHRDHDDEQGLATVQRHGPAVRHTTGQCAKSGEVRRPDATTATKCNAASVLTWNLDNFGLFIKLQNHLVMDIVLCIPLSIRAASGLTIAD